MSAIRARYLDPSNRAGYLFNTTIAGIDKADACVLIGTDPRYEAAIINARLQYICGGTDPEEACCSWPPPDTKQTRLRREIPPTPPRGRRWRSFAEYQCWPQRWAQGQGIPYPEYVPPSRAPA